MQFLAGFHALVGRLPRKSGVGERQMQSRQPAQMIAQCRQFAAMPINRSHTGTNASFLWAPVLARRGYLDCLLELFADDDREYRSCRVDFHPFFGRGRRPFWNEQAKAQNVYLVGVILGPALPVCCPVLQSLHAATAVGVRPVTTPGLKQLPISCPPHIQDQSFSRKPDHSLP